MECFFPRSLIFPGSTLASLGEAGKLRRVHLFPGPLVSPGLIVASLREAREAWRIGRGYLFSMSPIAPGLKSPSGRRWSVVWQSAVSN